MCDTIAGELILSFHRDDSAAYGLLEDISGGRIPHIQILESLPEKLSGVDLSIREDLVFRFYRLGVPPGQEVWKINYLQFFYKHAILAALGNGRMTVGMDVITHSDYHLQVVPNSVLSVAASSPSSGFGTISLTQTHNTYQKLIGWRTPLNGAAGQTILILDTGTDTNITYNSSESRNFVDQTRASDVSDDNGHGTAVAAIIGDLCPLADLVIFKVADKNGRASEWDTLAALAATSQAKVINMSLAFGLDDIACLNCGRESQSSRSAVFENLISQVDKPTGGSVIVAAAGNRKKSELSFPARFGSVLAIESVDSSGNLSEFTNRSTTDHEGNNHLSVFVLPGGQKDSNNNVIEHSVETSLGKKYCGTSFAAAYATALVANAWSDPTQSNKDPKQIIDHLRAHADTRLPNFAATIYGNGLMRLP